MDNFEDIFSGETEAEDTPAITPEPETIGQPRDESGKFAAKEPTGVDEQETANPVPPTDKLPQEDYKAIRDEREKRQRAEDRAAALEAQLASLQNPPTAPPSIWDDDQGALQHVKQEAIAAAVQQANFNSKLDMSEMMVRQANADFEEVKAEFLALAQANPTLVQQALADPHPWNKAYQIAKNHKAMQELGSVNVADMEAKLREKIMAEMQAQAPAPSNLPTSLAGSQSARSSINAPRTTLSIEDIIGR